MLTKARIALPDSPRETEVWVDYSEPDMQMLNGTWSKQYTIEFQAADLPALPEGTNLVLELAGGDVLFRVREAARVDEGQNSGAFRRVLLTKIAS